MPVHNTNDSFGSVTKTFHWLTALLILTAIPLGLWANRLELTPETLELKVRLFSLHKTVGITAFAVGLLRILWALSQAKPGQLHPDRRLENFLADLVHWLLYISLVAVPLTGWLHHAAATGFAPILWPFGQNLPFVPKDEGVAELFSALHLAFTKLLGLAVLLHIAGALKHHILDRDATLRRMLPGHPILPEVPLRGSHLAPALAALLIYGCAIYASGIFAPHEARSAEAPAAAPAESVGGNWVVEEGQLGLTIRQLGNDVSGSFTDWSADILFDEGAEGGTKGSVSVTIATGSLALGTVTEQALGPDFLDASLFPNATYAGDITAGEAQDSYRVNGVLTIRDTALPVPLDFILAIDGDTARMEGTAAINRQDFGMGPNFPDESALGFDVRIDVQLTAKREPE